MADAPDSTDKKTDPAPITGRARSLANLRPPFKKGEPPPPGGGRPKGLAAQVRKEWPQEKLVQHYTEIAEGRNKAFNANHRMEALRWLAERGFGKTPDVSLTGELDGEATKEALGDLETEDLHELLTLAKKTGT